MTQKCNEKITEIEQYLRKHKIQELFEDLCSSVAYKKPDNLINFLIEELEIREKHGPNIPIFKEEEIRNIFNLFDLKQEGKIPKIKCKEALKTISNSTVKTEEIENYDIPNDVNYDIFKDLCNNILGVK